jgi:hypothetical protein
MFDYCANVGVPKLFAEMIPVISLVCGNRLSLVEVPCEYLPPDLGVVWLLRQTVNI